MIKQLSKLWRWSWLITLPIAVVYIFWSINTVQRMYRFGVRYDPAPARRIALVHMGRHEFGHLMRQAKVVIDQFLPSLQPRENKLRTIHLFVAEANLAKLNSHLPYSGFQYVPGSLWGEDRFVKAKLRYRGDTPAHWALHKKSWRVKTSKKFLFNGIRTFNLIVPEDSGQLNTYFAYRLANIMGLIAPQTEVVELSLNGKPRGWHVLVEQLDEITLRSHNRMPGDLFAGELVLKDRYLGASKNVFEHPGLWEKIAINNHYPEDARASIQHLTDLVRSPPSEERHQQLSRLLDMESWGRFSAFEALVQTFHYNNAHNWRLYFDPGTSRLIPVVWDPLGWIPSWMRKKDKGVHLKIISSQLHQFLFQNADFLKARERQLERFFISGMDREFMAEINGMIRQLEPAVSKDPNADYLDSRKTIADMRTLEANINRVLKSWKTHILDPLGDHRYHYSPEEGTLAIAIGGQRSSRSFVARFQHPIHSVTAAWIRYRQGGRIHEKDVSGALEVQGTKLTFEIDLIPSTDPMADFRRQNGCDCQFPTNPVAHYELIFDGLDSNNPLLEVLVDRGLGVFERASEVERPTLGSFENLYLVERGHPLETPIVWEGKITIEGVRVIEKELIISPGTEVRFLPGAGIIVKQRLLARGDPHSPIRFLPASRGQAPWGAVVLHGKGANGSLLENCEFADGSGLKGDLFEYSAMLSIHDVQGVKVEACRFSNNRLVDDMVHAVYADIRFRSCEFSGALSDALDLDICQAIIENCRFQKSGNDGLDLMATRALVLNTLLKGNGDKGISVGEGSRLFAVNSIMESNKIGLQSKDGSVAVAYNVNFQDNAHAVDAYKKNWRYGDGGKVFIYKSKLKGNEKMITADKRSAIWIYDSYVDRMISGKKRITVHDTVDSAYIDRSVVKKFWRFPEEKVESKVLGRDAIKEMDANRRGAIQVGG